MFLIFQLFPVFLIKIIKKKSKNKKNALIFDFFNFSNYLNYFLHFYRIKEIKKIKDCFKTKGARHIDPKVPSYPPPPHGMVPKSAFCSIPHENVVFAVFFAWWVAGAVHNPANSLDFCNQPSENVLFAMFRLRHRGVVPPRPLLFLCQIII